MSNDNESLKIHIRETFTNDFDDIMLVEERAFGMKKEADLTKELLSDETARPFLSLLALDGSMPVGHILFTRVYMDAMRTGQPLLHLLAPLAVVPERQGQGIGAALIKEGLKSLRKMGSEMVFVLGHIGYYDRFGFTVDAKAKGYEAPFPIPEEFKEAWMVQSLRSDTFHINPGKVRCANALNKEEHWRE